MSELLPERFEPGDSILHQAVGEEAVFLNLVSQQYYGLDKMGAAMWQALIRQGTISAVAKEISTTYEVDEPRVVEDLTAMAREMLEAGILKPAAGERT